MHYHIDSVIRPLVPVRLRDLIRFGIQQLTRRLLHRLAHHFTQL